MRSLDQFINETQYAIRHYDDVATKKLLQDLASFMSSQSFKQQDPNLYEKLQKIMIYLKIVSIPQLTDEEVADVLRNNYLESYDIEIDMENRLTAKLFFVPEIPRDELRKKLKRGIMENTQKLGPLTVSQWIYEFEKMYPVKTRNLSASVDFTVTHPQAQRLDPISKNRLKELLYTYDYLLVTTLPATGPVLTEILTYPWPEETEEDSLESYFDVPNYISSTSLTANQKEKATSQIIKITIQEALKNPEELGEQLITSQYLRLKSFPQPVRPSIKNWISDYTFNTGYDHHTSITRGEYLYKNENTKNLSLQDRERLSYILKAFDENSLVNVDVNNKEIVFPATRNNEQRTMNNDQGSMINKASIANGPRTMNNNRVDLSAYNPNSAKSEVSLPVPEVKPLRQENPSESSYPRKSMDNDLRARDNREPRLANPEGMENKPVRPKNQLQFEDDNYFANLSPSYRAAPNILEEPKMTFSSPQKLAFEKVQEKPASAPPKTPVYPPHRITPIPKKEEDQKFSRPLPKNVVNLKSNDDL